MLDEERYEELHPGAPVFDVAPVRSRRAVPRAVLAAVVVGVIAFVGGIAVASSGPTQRERLATVPTAAPITTAPRSTPRPTAPPTPGPATAPGSSEFAAGFQPAAMITGLRDGSACSTGAARDKEVPRTRRDGPRMTFQRSWMVYCPVPEEQRQAFLVALFKGLVRAVPADTFGYAAAGVGAGDALFPYSEAPLAGTVAVTADAAGDGFAIAIVLQEWRTE